MLWRWIISWLVWLSADPMAVDLERPKAAAAVAAARASLAVDAPAPTPGPKPPAPTPGVCEACGGRGYVVMPDGHRIVCGACKKTKQADCPDGRCPAPGASPATVLPAQPAGGR